MAEAKKEDLSSWLVVATTIFLIWALIFVGIRLWVKLKRNVPWALHDSFFALAFTLAACQSATLYVAVHNGFGTEAGGPSAKSYLSMAKAVYCSEILYLMSIGLSKLSTVLFMSTIARDTLQQRVCYSVTTAVACWTTASVLVIALRGELRAPWLTIYSHDGLFKRWLGIESSGLVLELAMWCMSVLLCWGLNMPLNKRLKLIGIFGLRIILVPIISLRLYFLSRPQSNSDISAAIIAQIFTEGAMQYSLMAECTTCFKPFLHPFHSTYGWRNADQGSEPRYGLGSLSTNPKLDIYTSTSTSRTSRRESELRMPGRAASKRTGLQPVEDLEEALRLRGDDISYSTKIGRDAADHRPMASDNYTIPKQSGRIHQTTTVSVSVDDDDDDVSPVRDG